ncbi:CAAX geranylgeranyltransferase alpha subunit [Coemansia javaensis]|uniref:Protein farnesyltransferase/geranylgeranyltransferase type-1 subunit alpha n=1 Tax=Coemansia javaensis TaxID=2761396 RepID=A0A9W8LKZ4_9FUNG|nr:CAAX geranylgeranyltransferase alpha subunit [Coemansia javaensis]
MRIEATDDLPPPPELPMSQQPEWSDVTPLPQDDGDSPICPIAYTDEYRERMDYLRAVMAKGEVSRRALALTARVIEANPGHYTVWVYRKRLVEDLAADIAAELDWVCDISEMYPKNYQLWHHRETLVTRLLPPAAALDLPEDRRIAHPTIRRELQFLGRAIGEDSKNFHAWSYRQWLVATYAIWDQELAFVDTMINEDVRNNSAWNQRYFVVLRGRDPASAALDDALVLREIDYAVENIKLAPNNESPWSYVVGMLLRHAPARLYTDLLPRITALAAAADYRAAMTTTPFYWSALVDIYEQHAAAAAAAAAAAQPERAAELLDQARAACDALSTEHDPVRGAYWAFRKTTLV